MFLPFQWKNSYLREQPRNAQIFCLHSPGFQPKSLFFFLPCRQIVWGHDLMFHTLIEHLTALSWSSELWFPQPSLTLVSVPKFLVLEGKCTLGRACPLSSALCFRESWPRISEHLKLSQVIFLCKVPFSLEVHRGWKYNIVWPH